MAKVNKSPKEAVLTMTLEHLLKEKVGAEQMAQQTLLAHYEALGQIKYLQALIQRLNGKEPM